MVDMNGGAPSSNGGPKTRSAIMAGIRSAPQSVPSTPSVTQPTVTAPTQPASEKPAPVEAVKLELGGGAGKLDSPPLGVESTEATPGVETQNDVTPETEAIDYVQKYQEIMDAGDLHESLYDKLGMAKINGIDVPISVKEAFKGYQRRSDHSRAMNELQSQEIQLNSERQKIATMWGAFKDKPELAVEVFQERFGDSWIDQMVQVRQRAIEEYENSILDAGHRVVTQLGIDPKMAAQDPRVIAAMSQAKERLDRQRTLEAENRALKRKAEELERAQSEVVEKQEQSSYGQQFLATIKRFQDAALKAEALPCNDLMKSELHQTVAQLLIARNQGVAKEQRNYSITQELVREAASILKETKDDARRAESGTQEQPLPPRQGMGVGTGGAVKNNGRPMTRSQLMASVRGQR